jgi:hypothetical protein
MNSNKIISNKKLTNKILKPLYQPGKGINSGCLIDSFLNIETGEEYKSTNNNSKTGVKYKKVPKENSADYTYDIKTRTFTYWKEQEK